MRQHLSVLMLAARSTVYKVLGLFVAMAVTESALFYVALQKYLGGEPVGLERLIDQSRIALVSGACFFLLCILLSLTGCEFGGGKLRYTVQRLSIRESALTLWWAGYNAICFFLFWAVQLVITWLLCRLYVARTDAAFVSGQSILLAFYRNDWLHSLLPLEETSRYVRNVILILCLGICAACFSFRQRRGERGIAIVALAVIVAISFSESMGGFSSDLWLALIALAITTGAVMGLWKERDDGYVS